MVCDKEDNCDLTLNETKGVLDDEPWFLVYGTDDDIILDFWKHLGSDMTFEEFKTQLETVKTKKNKNSWDFYKLFTVLWSTSAWFSVLWSVMSYRTYMTWFLRWYFGF